MDNQHGVLTIDGFLVRVRALSQWASDRRDSRRRRAARVVSLRTDERPDMRLPDRPPIVA